MNDINAIKLVNLIRQISQQKNKQDNLIFGVVESVEPLKINIGNNVILTEDFLILGQMCKPHKVTIPHSHLINALLSEKSKSIKKTTNGITQAPILIQNTGSYEVKTQEIKRNDDKGIDERKLKTENKTNVDLGGAELTSSVIVTGQAAVTSSVVNVIDNGHQHIVPEHKTQDVHFPATDYEESVTIEIYPRLKAGDKVLMFAFNNYQLYYVAERITE